MTQHSKVRMFRNISTSQTIYRVKTKLSLHVLGFCSTYFEVANKRVASNHIVVFAQRFLELLLGKQEISDVRNMRINPLVK